MPSLICQVTTNAFLKYQGSLPQPHPLILLVNVDKFEDSEMQLKLSESTNNFFKIN